MMHGGYGMFGGGSILGLIIIAILAYFIIKYFNEKNSSNIFNRKGNAIDLLNERYAKGEIDDEEYNRRKNVLKD